MSEERYFSKAYIICLFISIAFIFSALIFGSYEGYSVDFETANQTLTAIEQERQVITVSSIFFNNFELTLVTFIPFIGLFWEFFVTFNTGYFIGQLAKATGMNNVLYVSLLVTHPVGVIEFTAYVFVLAESLVLINSLFKHEFRERLTKQSWKTFLLATALLFIGAVIECYLIRGDIIF